MIAAPFPKSWWVDPPHFLAGCYPGDLDFDVARTKLAALLDAGMRVFISLQEEREKGADGKPFVPYEPVLMELAKSRAEVVSCERVPIRDCRAPTRAGMNTLLDRIDRAIEERLPVYLHCWGGHGRTGMVVGCWLVRHGLTPNQTMIRIKELRRHDPYLREQRVPQTPEQLQFLLEWPRYDHRLMV